MIYDVIIIGMGIAGVSSAIYAKNGGLNVLMLEKEAPGGLLNKINTINNYPGYSKISGPDLSYNLFQSITDLNIPYKIEEVINIEVKDDLKIVRTNNNEYQTKYIIIASGRNSKKLNLNNEKELLGHGVSNCALCDGSLYKNEDIAVVGGGNSALEEAIYLAKLAKKVYLIHRRDEFRADKYLIDEVKKQKNIEIIFNSNVTKINADGETLKSIEINNQEELNVKGLFIYVGFEANTSYLSSLNILNETGKILVNDDYETSIKGIYAVGDALEKKVYQLVTAASEGAIAGINVIKQNQKDN